MHINPGLLLRRVIKLLALPVRFVRLVRWCAFWVQNGALLAFHGVKHEDFAISGVLFIRNYGLITVGRFFRANSGRSFNPIGGDVVTRLIAGPEGKILIGERVAISNSTLYARKEIIIGDRVLIGGGTRIWDTDFHSLDSDVRGTARDGQSARCKPIKIGHDVFIGGGCIILKGVEIGENSVIAAGSVVTRSVPANEIWGGNPAAKIRSL